VAAGLCDFAVGTQTAGSVIRPAAFCGVLGAVPAYAEAKDSGMLAGLVPAAPPLDVVGVLSDSWDILYAAMGAMLGRQNPEANPGQSGASLVKGRLALPVGPYAQQASAEARSILDAAALFLEQEGIMEVSTVEPWDAAQLEAVRQAHHGILAHEMHVYFGASLSAAPLDEKGHALDELLRAGGRVTDAELRDCLTLQESEARRLSRLAVEHGILGWLAPSTVTHAPAGLESTGMRGVAIKCGQTNKDQEERVSPAPPKLQEVLP
jgi:amidase